MAFLASSTFTCSCFDFLFTQKIIKKKPIVFKRGFSCQKLLYYRHFEISLKVSFLRNNIAQYQKKNANLSFNHLHFNGLAKKAPTLEVQ